MSMIISVDHIPWYIFNKVRPQDFEVGDLVSPKLERIVKNNDEHIKKVIHAWNTQRRASTKNMEIKQVEMLL